MRVPDERPGGGREADERPGRGVLRRGGNIGLLEERVGKAPVITDPGHALPLSRRWESVQVPVLP